MKGLAVCLDVCLLYKLVMSQCGDLRLLFCPQVARSQSDLLGLTFLLNILELMQHSCTVFVQL